MATRATAAQRLTTVSDTSFEEKCTLLQMPQGESQAGQGSAQAAPVAPPMPTTATEVQQPNWWVVPKAPHPKLLPAAIAPALHADNTAREGKHQYVANFFSYLTTQEKFETAQEEFFRVGHTHNEQDQRFSSVATILSRARTLESPEDFSGANSGQ